MNEKIYNKKQRDLIRAFDKELFCYTGAIAWLLPAIFTFIILIAIALPVQEVEQDGKIFFYSISMLSVMISYSILLPYVNTTDAMSSRQRNSGTYDKLKYLPISKHQYRIVRMGYLFRYFWKFSLAGLVIQCTTSLLSGNVSIKNILYVIVVLFVIPLITGWLQLLIER